MATDSVISLPSNLMYLVSNFHNFVTLKLDGENYVLWKFQVYGAFDANDFLGYIDGTIICPDVQIKNACDVLVDNPAYKLWKLIDGQIFSCILSTISANILPHILELKHVYQVWKYLENRYIDLSRSHVHDLKRQLFSIQKKSTMDKYVDHLKQCAYKLAAVGSPVLDEDLVFHALNGLPVEFRAFKTAIRARAGTIKFEELVTLLNAEEMHNIRDQSSDISQSSNSSMFLTNQTSNQSDKIGNSSEVYNAAVSQALNNKIDGSSNKDKGAGVYPQNVWFNNSQQIMCQICGKYNHIASDCYHRANLNFRPPKFQTN